MKNRNKKIYYDFNYTGLALSILKSILQVRVSIKIPVPLAVLSIAQIHIFSHLPVYHFSAIVTPPLQLGEIKFTKNLVLLITELG